MKYSRAPILDIGSGDGRIEKAYKVDLAIDYQDDSAKKYTKYIKHDLNKIPYPVNYHGFRFAQPVASLEWFS